MTKAGPPTALKTRLRAAEDDVALRVAGVQRGTRSAWSRSSVLGLGRVEPDASAPSRSTVAPAPANASSDPVAEDLEADLGEDPQRRAVDRLDLVGGQDLDRPERVDEPAPRQLLDAPARRGAAGGGAPRAAGGGRGRSVGSIARMLRRPTVGRGRVVPPAGRRTRIS